VVVLGVALAGCSSDTQTTAADSAVPECSIAVSDAWVKAAKKGAMTAAFGTLANTGSGDLVIDGGTTDSAKMVELHEVVGSGADAMMQPKEGGFSIPAGSEVRLEPGGLHIMLLDVTSTIQPGDEVSVELSCAGGGTADYVGLAKDFTGAEEDYQNGESSMPMTHEGATGSTTGEESSGDMG
jgi:hypothetical protein